MHANTDSEVTSLSASSPTRSPRRPVYYVQSPSRDSHDGEKTTNSFHSTPVLSPMGSPPHSHSSLDRHSRQSSSSRFSGSRKMPRKPHKPWKEGHVIEEEGLLELQPPPNTLPRRCYYLAFLLAFILLFSLFSLILWAASKPMKPKITIKSIKFDHVRVQAGSDSTGVATDMISMNSTVRFTYRNTGTFFGVHVTSTPLDLFYSEIKIASGNMHKFYQSRKSERRVNVAVMGNKIPLYGSGASLSSTTGVPTVPVKLNLNFVVRSRAYVLGKLVKPKFYKRIECSITLDPKKINVSLSLKNSCTYH
ncbi:Late embryogenesis abundant protein, LEA-14 [Senna tora]|uniref:Late embryogenesis abundant protein, LEA-14 n=1 Tax=Senna tora TaxID=362788 RepID=A0A834WE01_9FABA|nr:Late embryogenesis abundant protein, LEA-14 [Senna tora]